MKDICIDKRFIGRSHKPYVVAELSANHNGSLQCALDTISSAKQCGADAIKIQSYTPDTITLNSELPDFLIEDGLWKGQSLYELYKSAYTPFEWHKPIFDHARSEGITCFSSPFDNTAVDLLEDLNTPAYKIASFEIIDIPLIKYAASTKKPIILSTGMADREEIQEAIDAVYSQGNQNLIVLHCVSGYPTPYDQMNVSMVQTIAKDFNVLTGLSDHSHGTLASTVAVALGACFIEKHFILDRDQGGPDSSFSLEPSELKSLVSDCQNAFLTLGKPDYERQKAEKENMKFRRSIYAVKDIKKGQAFTDENIRIVRPGYGIAPKFIDRLMGKVATRDIRANTPISTNDL